MKNNIIVGVVVAVVAVVSTLIYVQGHEEEVSVNASTAGSTFNTAKVALVAIDLNSTGANGTSTSILNTDSTDRFITSVKAGCQNLGTSKTTTGGLLASLTLSLATSSTASPVSNTNANVVGGGAVNIGTTTGNFAVSTSSATSLGSAAVYNIWSTGSYLTITSNATNTATCTAGVEYFGS